MTDQQIKLSKLQTRLFGGSASGEAQIDNWLHSIPPPQAGKAAKGGQDLPVIGVFHPPAKKGAVKTKGPGVLVGTVRIRVRDFSNRDVATALSKNTQALSRVCTAVAIPGLLATASKE